MNNVAEQAMRLLYKYQHANQQYADTKYVKYVKADSTFYEAASVITFAYSLDCDIDTLNAFAKELAYSLPNNFTHSIPKEIQMRLHDGAAEKQELLFAFKEVELEIAKKSQEPAMIQFVYQASVDNAICRLQAKYLFPLAVAEQDELKQESGSNKQALDALKASLLESLKKLSTRAKDFQFLYGLKITDFHLEMSEKLPKSTQLTNYVVSGRHKLQSKRCFFNLPLDDSMRFFTFFHIENHGQAGQADAELAMAAGPSAASSSSRQAIVTDTCLPIVASISR